MSESEELEISFQAFIPNNQTAIQVHGGGGMRFTLEVPDNQLGESIGIVQMRDHVLQVTIKVLPHVTYGTGKPPKEKPSWLKPTKDG
jgi:hypothetical protein